MLGGNPFFIVASGLPSVVAIKQTIWHECFWGNAFPSSIKDFPTSTKGRQLCLPLAPLGLQTLWVRLTTVGEKN